MRLIDKIRMEFEAGYAPPELFEVMLDKLIASGVDLTRPALPSSWMCWS